MLRTSTLLFRDMAASWTGWIVSSSWVFAYVFPRSSLAHIWCKNCGYRASFDRLCLDWVVFVQTYTFYSTFCETPGDFSPTAASVLDTAKQLSPDAQSELLEGLRTLVDGHS